MAIVFSKVLLNSENQQTEFWVCGIPHGMEDLECYKSFEDFLDELDSDDVNAVVQTYLYGEGETHTASFEELIYMLQRMEHDEDFLTKRCTCLENSSFSFSYIESELYGDVSGEREHPKLIGYSEKGEPTELNSIKEVAEYIHTEGQKGDVTITYEDGSFCLNTFGVFIDRISDMEYREELLKELVPKQLELTGNANLTMSM